MVVLIAYPAVFDILACKRDYSIPHRPFPIGGPLEPSLYL